MHLKTNGFLTRGLLGVGPSCLLLTVLVVLLGCSRESPKSTAGAVDAPVAELLEHLTATDEAVRFAVLDSAMQQIDHVSTGDVEAALTALRPKNVSTLIYVCIQTKSRLLFGLSPASQTTLEHSAGSFPNLPYYLARVDPAAGLPILLSLYERHPNQRMAVCLAIGEICGPKATGFLLDQARRIKSAGGEIVAPLSGLKHTCEKINPEAIDWLLAQQLSREETIALSELDLNLPPERLKALWQVGGRERFFAVEVILSKPLTHLEILSWMVDQYLRLADENTVRELMHSDSMRAVTDRRLVEFREATLAKLPLKK